MELTSVIVIPARDEQHTIAACLEAVAGQTVPAGSFETIVVLDRCVDETERVAVEAADRLGLRLRLLIGPGTGAGPARKQGMDAAAQRLFEVGRDDGLIACTDADSEPAPDWLARQLDHLRPSASAWLPG